MIYLLDPNGCIACLRQATGSVARMLATVAPAEVAITAVTSAELYRGAHLSARVAENLAHVAAFLALFSLLPFDGAAGETAGRIDADLARQGQRIGPYDTQIAAIALVHDLTLVTHNTGEFRRVAGLRLVDWEST